MGFFLSSLNSQLSAFQSKIARWSEPLDKVRQYHGIFKSVCDTFVIKNDQFSSIFGSEEKLSLWQGNSTINALELFCGLGFYASASSFKLKLKFLFALFDFNEIKSISVVDLEYMILSILNFTYRILGKSNSRADQLRLAEWLVKFVNPQKRLNINILARFCHQSEQAKSFLKLTNNLEEGIKQNLCEIYDQEKQMDENQRAALIAERRQTQLTTKLSWFSNFYQKLTKPKFKKEKKSHTQLSWVYGIDLQRCAMPFLVLADERILYSISSKIIIYNPKSKSQSIYSHHEKEVDGFAVHESSGIVASSEGQVFPKLYIWSLKTLQTINIVNIHHSHRIRLLSFSEAGLLVTVGSRIHSPILIYDSRESFKLTASFSVEQQISTLISFYTPLQLQNIPLELSNLFVMASKHSILVIDNKCAKFSIRHQSAITSVAISYMSAQQPYLRYFTGQSLRLFILSSHQTGAINLTILDPDNQISPYEIQKYQIFKFEEAPKQVILTEQSFFIILSSEIRVYDLCIFLLEEKLADVDQCRIIKIDGESLRLLSHELVYAAVGKNCILATTKEGDFLRINDREIEFINNTKQKESIERLDEFVRLGHKLKAICFAEKDMQGTIMVVSDNKRILQIDPETHKINLMLEISYQDVITVIDYAVSQQGPAYLVCGSQSGKLLVRMDEQEIAKVYDCQSEITDLKISKDASYLLVATLNSVMFFQLMPSFSSPRKIVYENQSPISLNFLDNPRLCTVGTSAKNIYLIQVPQLKHRNVQKDNECFSTTQMSIDFPHRLTGSSSKLTYSRCYLGGDMKFYLISLTTGEILYFPSMGSLPLKNYIILKSHKCAISNIVVSDQQQIFFTVGQTDGMLLQWSVSTQQQVLKVQKGGHPQTKRRQQDSLGTQIEIFKRIKQASQITQQKSESLCQCTFFFRGTKINKLNRKLHEHLKINSESYSQQETALMKRHCKSYLKLDSVYGLESDKFGVVKYMSKRPDDNRIIYSSSRFLVETEGEGNGSKIYQTSSRIAFFSLTDLSEPVYAQSGQYPRIFVSGVEAFRTQHKKGLIHFSIRQNVILSYGLGDDCYSLNLHNFRTGKLIAERTTFHEVSSFLILSTDKFVSLPDVRVWKGLISQQIVVKASSGVVLPGQRDICLGGMRGELSILSDNGVFTMASNAHHKDIIALKVNQLPSSFEIISASLDETVKLWNEYFEQLLIINLSVQGQFKILRDPDTLSIEVNPRSQSFAVKSLDCKNNRILLATSIGQIWQFQVFVKEEKVHQIIDISSSGNLSDESSDQLEQLPFRSQKMQMNYYVQRKRILNAHTSYFVPPPQRYVVFDVHLELPIFVSSGSDGRIIFRDYLREQVIGNYICQRDERVKIRAIRFAPRGRMVLVGFSSGVVRAFCMDISFTAGKTISKIELNHSQTFNKFQDTCEVIEIVYNQKGDMFAVSFNQISAKRQRMLDQKLTSPILIFKMKQQANKNPDESFYQQKEQIKLKDDQMNGKANRNAVKLQFTNKNGKQYLFFSEQLFDNNGLKIFSFKPKYTVYCLDSSGCLTDEFSIPWDQFSFPSLINMRYYNPKSDEVYENYNITSMLKYKDTIIYGGYDGKLHLVRLQSLDAFEDISEYRISEMCLSRIFSALTTPILDLKISEIGIKRFLFVSGYGDECILKFQLIEEGYNYFLQHQPYHLENEDPFRQFLNKQYFYLTINNRQPLREELTNILQDVQQPPKQNLLQFVRIFGRRGLDRRYNIAYLDHNILYNIGPNLVVEDLKNHSQYLLRADPSPYSHHPQISSFHYDNSILIVATQQERSNLYVWDIKSNSCLSSMKVECCFVFLLRLVGNENAIYLGVSEKYEPIIAIVDWRHRCTLGSMRFAFSSLSMIRDLVGIEGKTGKQFITCGNLHLCEWQLRGDTLCYHNFNNQASARYVAVAYHNGYLLSACEEGSIYLWRDHQLLNVLNCHKAAILCLQTDRDRDIIFSGGKDGLVLLLQINENKLSISNRFEIFEEEEDVIEESFKVQHQIQSLYPSVQDKSILVGTRSGSIYEIKYSEESESINLLFDHHDNQTVVSATFSAFDCRSFYVLTNAGLIQRYNLFTLNKTKSFNLGQRALKIKSCGEYLLVCCRQQLIAYKILVQQASLQKSQNLYIDARKLQGDGKQTQIIKFCLSKSQNLLALCTKSGAKEPTYQISIFTPKGQCLHQLGNLKHQIDYLDFSIDDKYLLFKDRYQEIGMVSLQKQFRRINTIFVQMGIQWQQEGLRLSPNAQSIYYSYSCENKITALARLGDNRLIVGDQMGTVRIFDYPCPDDRLGELHLHCYSVHMNDIEQIVVNPNKTHVLTIGLQDRSFVLWEIMQ